MTLNWLFTKRESFRFILFYIEFEVFIIFIEVEKDNLLLNHILGLTHSLKIIILRLLFIIFLREFYLLKFNEAQNKLKNT